MSDEEKLSDYDRLKLEYTRLHEDYRHLQSEVDRKDNLFLEFMYLYPDNKVDTEFYVKVEKELKTKK